MTHDNGNAQSPNAHQSGWSAPGGFFDWIRGTGMRRTDDRWVAGVCGGIAERTGLDPMLVRGIAIVVALLGGPILLAYAAGWALLPDTQGSIHFQRMLQGIFDPALIAIGVLVVLTFVPFTQGLWWQGAPGWWGMPGWLEGMLRAGWVVVLVGGIIWLIVAIARRAPRTDPADPTAPRSHTDYWGAGEASTAAGTASFAAGTTGAAEPSVSAAQPDQAAQPGQQAPFAPTYESPYQQPGAYQTPTAMHYQAAQQRQSEARAQHEVRMRENARRRAENAAQWRARQPGAGFVAISLGLALVGGVLASAPSALSSGWTQTSLVYGLAGALGVLAIATIIAGIRGRESGGLGFFSTITVIALLFAGVAPQGAQFAAFSNTTWRVSESQNYVAAFGTTTYDLTELEAGQDAADINVWVAFGTSDVIVPDDVPIEVHFYGAAATADADAGSEVDGSLRGLFSSGAVQNTAAEDADDADITTINVRMIFGTTDITVRSAS